MKYKLFLSDYDGTLGDFNDIDEATVKAIKDYQSRGGKFVICSGRSFPSIKPILNKYGITGEIISYQGAEILNIESERAIFDGSVDKKTILQLKDDLVSEGLCVGIYLGEYLHYEHVNEEMDSYLKYVGVGAIKVDSLEEYILNSPLKVRKMISLGKAIDIFALQKKYSEKYRGKLIINTSSARLMEAINPENSKGNGVKRIAKYYGIPLSEVITVGDSLNDIELVKGEWHGVAVGNAVEELKKVAKEVTVDFKDHPVKKLLEKYCL